MKHFMINYKSWLLGFIIATPSVLQASADFPIQISMVVVAGTCTVNGNNPITIKFGNIATNSINGSYKKQNISYTISCNGSQNVYTSLNITGRKTNFNTDLLQTTNSSLGIRFLVNDKPHPIGTSMKFIYPNNKPSLNAVLVKKDGATLSGGDFTAGAVLSVEYS